MNQDNEQINVEFHNRAKDLYVNLVSEFRETSQKTDRVKNEYLFQQLKEQYVKTLKQRLESIASQLIQKNQHSKQVNQLDQGFGYSIKQYLHQFVQETKRN